MADEYECVAKSKLHLKNDCQTKKKKKGKHKQKTREKIQHALTDIQEEDVQRFRTSTAAKLTKAEIAFKQQQENMRNKRIMDRASTTHKERVEKFNEHLDTLTEHFDIPKVSWTK